MKKKKVILDPIWVDSPLVNAYICQRICCGWFVLWFSLCYYWFISWFGCIRFWILIDDSCAETNNNVKKIMHCLRSTEKFAILMIWKEIWNRTANWFSSHNTMINKKKTVVYTRTNISTLILKSLWVFTLLFELIVERFGNVLYALLILAMWFCLWNASRIAK